MAEQSSSSRINLDTPVQQCEQRFKKPRKREKLKRDSETAEERRARLDKQKAYRQKRKASVTESTPAETISTAKNIY